MSRKMTKYITEFWVPLEGIKTKIVLEVLKSINEQLDTIALKK